MYTLPFALPNGCAHAGSLIVTSIFGAAGHYRYIFDNPHTKNRNRVVLEQVMEQVKKWKICSMC